MSNMFYSFRSVTVLANHDSQICRLSVCCLLKGHEHIEQRILPDLCPVSPHIARVQHGVTAHIPVVQLRRGEAGLGPAARAASLASVVTVGGAQVIANILRLYRGQVLE